MRAVAVVSGGFGATDRTPEHRLARGEAMLGVALAVAYNGSLPPRGEGQGGGPKEQTGPKE